MKIRLLVAALALPALAVGTSPAHAADVRVCDIQNGIADDVNWWTFNNGSWHNHVEGRDCTTLFGSPYAATVDAYGTYTGFPCLAAVLSGDATGTITAGVGEFVALTADGAIESTVVFSTQTVCAFATATTYQVHVKTT